MVRNRLSKILARMGVASRRACEEIIFSGRVMINGKIVLVPQTQVDEERDVIKLDGEVIKPCEEKAYFILNKPKGYICSNRRLNPNTKLVVDLFKGIPLRLFTVGRLDKDTTGLLIVTNDGHFANKVIHPSSNIKKEYTAMVEGAISSEDLARISKGTFVERTWVKPVMVSKVREGTLKIVIKEGKKREIRVLLEKYHLQVISLARVKIGNLSLGALPLGAFRPMTEREKGQIFES